MKDYKTDSIVNTKYEFFTQDLNIDQVIYLYFDYLLRIDTKDYYNFLNYLYNKYNNKTYAEIIIGVLKNMTTISNYTLDELDRETNFNNKKYILKKYKQIKYKQDLINNFYKSKLNNYKTKERKFSCKY